MRNGAEYNIDSDVINTTGASAFKDDENGTAALGIIDTCSISCRNYQMLTSGQFIAQCYRRCIPMHVSRCISSS